LNSYNQLLERCYEDDFDFLQGDILLELPNIDDHNNNNARLRMLMFLAKHRERYGYISSMHQLLQLMENGHQK
jgi:hypothetical protein